MENNNPGGINHNYLADLIDDFTHAELMSLLNWLAINKFRASRGAICGFRRVHLGKRM